MRQWSLDGTTASVWKWSLGGFTGYWMCLKITLDCKKKTSTSSNRRERPLIRKTGRGTTERERERHEDRKREKEGGRMQCFLKKEDRCRKCCNSRRKVLPSELTKNIDQFILYVHQNEEHFTHILCISHKMYLRRTTCTKTLPQM